MMPSKPLLTLVCAAAMVCGMGTPVFAWGQGSPHVPPALMLHAKPGGQHNDGLFDGVTAPPMPSARCTGLATSPCAPSIGQAMRDATHPMQVQPEQEKPTIHNQFQPVYRLQYGAFAWPAFPDPARVRTR
ncbi:MAG: hypothetical protein EOO27_32955 [Comamonadaceae bacterium]|nr:MAG: hypothetical protein EOO27_32955 [Comamonadaceae bacterium]